MFSGKITDFSELSVNKGEKTPTKGPITVVYRNGRLGHELPADQPPLGRLHDRQQQHHLHGDDDLRLAVPNSTPPANFIGEKGSSGVAGEIMTLPSAMAYLSPDFTSIDPNSGAPNHSLVVASVLLGKVAELPTTKNITTALARPVLGQNLTPPANAQEGANPGKLRAADPDRQRRLPDRGLHHVRFRAVLR